ncbi:MAG: hypothetical protein JKY71_08190 [Alphaproteobacteria bacterium]|nr:hypothetical protein [Alphaproteobacteria bacterium]
MELILVISLLVLIVVIFIIYPIILFFQCLFDSAVSAGTKILVFLTTLFVFPIPSFCYGAFVKNSGLSKFILAIYVILFVIAMIFVVFFGGAALIAGYMANEGVIDFQHMVETQSLPEPDTSSSPDVEYKGYNTYETDEVNVFESSGPDEEPLPVEPAPAPETQDQPSE